MIFAFTSAKAPLPLGAPQFLASPWWGYAPLALVTIAIAVFVYRLWRPIPQAGSVASLPAAPVESELRLQCYAGNRTATGLQTDNIWRWFTLLMIAQAMPEPGKRGKPMADHLMTALFITFDQPTTTNNLSISSPDMNLPRYEVKDFNQRSAIIVFDGALPVGTLVVQAHR